MLFVSMCVIWGIPYLLIKVAVTEISPATLVLARTGIAAVLLLPIAAARKELRPLLRYWRPVLVFATIEIAIPWMLLGVAEQRISSSLTALLIAAVPLVGALIGRTTGIARATRRAERDRPLPGPARSRGDRRSESGGRRGGAARRDGGRTRSATRSARSSCSATAGVPALGVHRRRRSALDGAGYVPIAAFSLPEQMPTGERRSARSSALAVVCTAVAFLVFFALIAEVGPVRATAFTT